MKNPSKARTSAAALGLGAYLVAALAWYYDVYVHWQSKLYPFAIAAATLGIVALTLLALWARGERKAGALVWKSALSMVIFTGLSLGGVTYLINNVINHEGGARQAAAVALPLCALQMLLLYVMLFRGPGKGIGRKTSGLMAAGVLAILLVAVGFGAVRPWYLKDYYTVPAPEVPEGKFAPRGPWGDMADFRVSPDGMSIEEARDAIRAARANGEERDFSVEILPGEYNIRQIVFDERDYNTLYSTRSEEDEAILNGGMRLEPGDFSPWDKDESIQLIDLTKLGLTADDWGKMYSFGGFTTAAMYDDGVGPLPCELFFNGKRCVTARYPNDGWLQTGKVLDNGDSRETYEGGTVRNPDFDQMRNPRGGAFALDEKTAKRAAGWALSDDIWVFGCFRHDWADMSTPVKSIENGALTTAYASGYGFKSGANYYFYNVLEELDEPGEWYLDRNTGLLYLWPPEEIFADARIDISLSAEALISGENLKNLSFIGLTLQGTRGGGMALTGDDIFVDHCLVKNLAGSAISVTGYRNTVSNCEVRHVGREGIVIGGGDQASLTSGGSLAVNNLVHDWSEVVMTYQGGIRVNGTGNRAANNELYNSRHTAIFFDGNDHVIERNLIHDVCLETSDAGAIYDGRSFYSAQGTVIRENVIYNLGSGKHNPCGIYLDDGLSGVTVENNLLVNIPGTAIAVSGRDLDIQGNFVVNAGKPLSYDQRTRDGALATDPNFWFHAHTGKDRGDMWKRLLESPWRTDVWRAAYPKLAAYSTDFADIEGPSFAANPAGSSVAGNVFAGPNKPSYAESVRRFSTIGPNDEYGAAKARRYWTLPGYEKIPLALVGRTGES